MRQFTLVYTIPTKLNNFCVRTTSVVLILTNLSNRGNPLENIACWKQEINSGPLRNYPSKERIARPKLNCLNSNYKLGLKVPLKNKTNKTHLTIPRLVLLLLITLQNQRSVIQNHKKHPLTIKDHVINREPKLSYKLAKKNPQILKFPVRRYRIGAHQVNRDLPSTLHWISGQPIFYFIYRPLSTYVKPSFLANPINLKTIHKIRAENPNYIFHSVYHIILSEELLLQTLHSLTLEEHQHQNPRFNEKDTIFITKKIISEITIQPTKGEKGFFTPLHFAHTLIALVLIRVFQLNNRPYQLQTKFQLHSHAQLKHLKLTFKACDSTVYGAITPISSSIHHQTLLTLVNTRIKDPLFINLLSNTLNSNPLTSWNFSGWTINRHHRNFLGVALINIYLQQFDKIVLQNFSTPYKTPYPYSRFYNQYIIGLRKANLNWNRLVDKIDKFNLLTGKTLDLYSSKAITPLYSHAPLHRISLRLNPSTDNKSEVVLITQLPFLINKLAQAGFCNYSGNPSPKLSVYPLASPKIITYYKQVFTLFSQPYLHTNNHQAVLNLLHYVLKTSCAKLLTMKMTQPSVKSTIKKFGDHLFFK